MSVVFKTKIGFDIKLIQKGPDNFTVVYGEQVRSHMDYGEAAKELGLCIMHALAAEGRLK